MERIAKVELEEIEEKELAESKAAEPIKDKEDIRRISEYLVEQGRYRDNMLFIVGINVGLRVSDLIELRMPMANTRQSLMYLSIRLAKAAKLQRIDG